MMADRKKNPTFQAILLSLFGFVLLWAVVTDAWGYSSHFGTENGYYVYAFLSRVIWVAPALWLIFRHSSFLRFSRQELFSRPVLNRSLVIVLAASLLFAFGGMLVTHRGFWLNPSVNPPLEIVTVVMVAFVEETVYRGWGYNALSQTVTDKKAVFYSTVFFVLLHWPAYFIRFYRFGTMDVSTWLTQSFTVAIWGVIGCLLLKRGKTIWNPIIAHAVYDVAVVLFVG